MRLFTVGIVLLSALAVHAEEARSYTITGIDLGGTFAEARSLNDSGEVAGMATDAAGWMFAFVHRNGVTTALPTLGGPIGNGYDINANGDVVGLSHDPNVKFQATRWNADGTTVGLGFLTPSSLPYTYAYGLNDQGVVVGFGSKNVGDDLQIHATCWVNGTIRDMGTLGGRMSTAWAVNNAGQVAGEAEDSTGKMRPVIWENGGTTIRALGAMPGIAYEINELGQTAAACMALRPGDSPEDDHRHAVLWDSDGRMIDIGTLGGHYSDAWGLNEASEVVGWAEISHNERRAFFWKDGTIVNLNDCIPAGSGWVLTTAWDINNRGEICGVGNIDGVTRGFLLRPVENLAPVLDSAPYASPNPVQMSP